MMLSVKVNPVAEKTRRLKVHVANVVRVYILDLIDRPTIGNQIDGLTGVALKLVPAICMRATVH
jgi:hypothetical protein